MADVIKALLAAPATAVLLVAGLAFLAVAIFRPVTDRLDAGPRGRLFAGVLGIVLIGISLYLSLGGKNPENATPPAAAATGAATQPDGGFPIALPAGQVVKQEDRTYAILKIALDRHEIDQLALTFTVRMTNRSSYPANFWNANFRLLADGAVLAPIGDLNELVDANATKDGTDAFAIPAATKKAALQIDTFGADAPGLAIDLPGQP
jgi:hypothetical protein